MSMSPPTPPRTRIGASLLGATFVAAATGALPVAGLAFQPVAPPRERPAPPEPVAVVEPVAVAQPVAVVEPEVPAGEPTLRSADAATQGPLRLDATLGQRTILRADGRVDLVVGVSVAEAPAAARGPIDLALVVDTSASMSGVIGLVKKATLGAIERLGERDRLVLVTYADEAKVLFTGPVTPDARAELERLVGRFVAARGTNIEAALAATRAAVGGLRVGRCGDRVPWPLRVVLISDGAPTVGATDPAALVQATAALCGAGATVSSVGLGASYQETLLANMADAGGGSFHHVDGPGALPAVYGAELEAQRTVVVRDARLRIATAPGVEVEGVTAWAHERGEEGGAVVALGDLSAGRSLKVVVRLKVATGLADAQSVAAVRLEAEGVGELSGPVRLETASLGVAITDDRAAAEASRVAEVEPDLRQAALSERLTEARAAAGRGEADRARALVREARELAGQDQVTFEAPSGEAQAVSLDALADDLAEGARSDRGRRAMKVTIAAERAVGR